MPPIAQLDQVDFTNTTNANSGIHAGLNNIWIDPAGAHAMNGAINISIASAMSNIGAGLINAVVELMVLLKPAKPAPAAWATP